MFENRREKTFWIGGSLLLVIILGMFLLAPAWTQHPKLAPREEMHHDMSGMPGMDHGMMMHEETPEQKAKHQLDKRESEFNHHFAGLLVVLAGLFFLVQDRLVKRWPAARYAWPMCFLAGGFFVLIFSDTEIWPMGYQSFYFAVTNDPEVAQHKLFALILLLLGSVEILRISGRWTAAWTAWVFPTIAIGGATLLLFHQHGGMHGPDAMQTMAQVQGEHLRFAGVGSVVAVTKGMAEYNVRWRNVLRKAWPILMIVLGLLLILYTE